MANPTVTNVTNAAQQLAVNRATEPFKPAANPLSAITDFISGVGLAVYSFIRNQSTAKKAEKKQKAIQTMKDYLVSLLATLEETGNTIVDETNLRPKTPDFEKVLHEVLGPKIGYIDSCNIDIPGLQKDSGVLLKIRNGQVIWIQPNTLLPPDFGLTWMSQCQSIHDNWESRYFKKQTGQARTQQTEALKADISSGNRLLFLGFGGLAAIIVVLMIKNALGGKNAR